MIEPAFQVYLNGKLLATVGILESGVLTGMVEIRKNDGGSDEASLDVQALANLDVERMEFRYWISEKLKEGDEINVKLIRAREITPPKSSRVEKRRNA